MIIEKNGLISESLKIGFTFISFGPQWKRNGRSEG